MCLFFCLIVLINVFLALDFFIFFFFFEAVIIPMFFIIGIWGSRSRKIYASYQFIIYTLLGSIFMLIAFLSVLFTKGTLFFEFIFTSYFFEYREFFFFFFLLLGFSVKIPVMPFHI